MAVNKMWKIHGLGEHRQAVSFQPSKTYDFSNERDGVRIISVFNSDVLNTNKFSILSITRNTEEECLRELKGQISDGIFENYRVGIIEELQ